MRHRTNIQACDGILTRTQNTGRKKYLCREDPSGAEDVEDGRIQVADWPAATHRTRTATAKRCRSFHCSDFQMLHSQSPFRISSNMYILVFSLAVYFYRIYRSIRWEEYARVYYPFTTEEYDESSMYSPPAHIRLRVEQAILHVLFKDSLIICVF